MRFVSILLYRIIILLSAIVLLLAGIKAYAEESDEVLVGALTQHFTDFGGVSRTFDNKVSADGTLIANPMIAWRIIEYEGLVYTSKVFFAGENSIGELMVGGGLSLGVKVDHVRLGLAAGGYVQDDQKFRDRNVAPFAMPLGNGSRYGLAPLAGVELSVDIPVANRVYLTSYTVITPVLMTTTFGFGWDL